MTHPGQIAWSQIPVMTKMSVGAREPMLSGDAGLKFRVLSKPMRFVEVELDASDTYTVRYSHIKRGSYERVVLEEVSGVYVEQLGETIYRATHS